MFYIITVQTYMKIAGFTSIRDEKFIKTFLTEIRIEIT